jgi:MFS family permease
MRTTSLMSTTGTIDIPVRRSRFYYGWIVMTVAALAMVATLPGRTQGLGLVTEPLLADFNLDRFTYATINLWATLIGALFSIGVGRFIDQIGSRVVVAVVSIALGLVVVAMSSITSVLWLTVLITLTRGFGQSALSVVSLTMVGQWFRRKLSLAMAIYAVVLSIGFMIAFPAVGGAVASRGWRPTWMAIGLTLLFIFTPIAIWLVRDTPESMGLALDGDAIRTGAGAGDAARVAAAHPPAMGSHAGVSEELTGMKWLDALRTPGFWVFALASSTYGLVSSGISLFNESILTERGFDYQTFYNSLIIVAMTGLLGNFIGGWLTDRWRMNRLMTVTMFLLMIALIALPSVQTVAHVMAYATVMGLAGGFVTVLFFGYWGRAYGRRELGRIQGSAQALTVFASAVGPLILAYSKNATGSYAACFYGIAILVGLLACASWVVPVPDAAGKTY